MAQATQALFDDRVDADTDVRALDVRAFALGSRTDIRLSLYDDLAAVATEWRAFEQNAHGTVFQTFEWVSTWHRHIGARKGTVPAIVVGRDGNGETLFVIPLAVEDQGFARRLT